MRCEKALNIYMSLDKNQRLPFSVFVHLLFCKRCKTIVRNLKFASTVCSDSINMGCHPSNDLIKRIMKKVESEGTLNAVQITKKEKQKLFVWLLSGIIVVVTALIPFTHISQRFASEFGKGFTLPFAFLTATSVIIYCSVLIDKNVDFLQKKFGLCKF